MERNIHISKPCHSSDVIYSISSLSTNSMWFSTIHCYLLIKDEKNVSKQQFVHSVCTTGSHQLLFSRFSYKFNKKIPVCKVCDKWEFPFLTLIAKTVVTINTISSNIFKVKLLKCIKQGKNRVWVWEKYVFSWNSRSWQVSSISPTAFNIHSKSISLIHSWTCSFRLSKAQRKWLLILTLH